jgi:hypothetical protein
MTILLSRLLALDELRENFVEGRHIFAARHNFATGGGDLLQHARRRGASVVCDQQHMPWGALIHSTYTWHTLQQSAVEWHRGLDLYYFATQCATPQFLRSCQRSNATMSEHSDPIAVLRLADILRRHN